MAKLSTILAVLVFALQAGWAQAAQPLVDVDWVRANGDRPEVVILDVRNKIDGGSRKVFEAGHIPGAVYSDYLKDGWRAKVDGVPGQLPPVDKLESLIGGLGIGNDSHVVVVAAGASALDMGSATRIYWTFKVLGHDEVSVLNGGYKAWVASAKNPVERGWNEPAPKVFKASLRREMLADRESVKAAMEAGTPLIDFRPPDQFNGEKAHKASKRPGTIPGAVNLPESKLTRGGGYFVGSDQVEELLAEIGLSGEGEQISFCNTGHWASLGWFAASEIGGNKSVRLYDGSMVDWSAQKDLPIEVKSR